LSDFHIDGLDGLAEVLADELARLPVDLCVLTGNYRFRVYGSCAAIYPRMRRILGAIQATHGVVGILGNHDCADIAVEFERFGVRMLVNEAVQVGSQGDGLRVIGIDHPRRPGEEELTSALEGVSSQEFKLLLAHTPEMFLRAAELGIDLYLTGHTHAGQIRLPVVGPIITHAKSPRRIAQGYWQHRGMQGFTSAGLGCSLLPIRFGCPPEIVVIELSGC
jgi:predicted MPP superfamily phosphohydrolase